MHIYQYEKYITTPENLRTTIDEYGVAIIPSVLNLEETQDMNNGMWDTLEHLTQNFEIPIKRNNKDD